MNKTKSYFTILIAVTAVIAVGYIFNIANIIYFTKQCLNYAGNNVIATSAAVCAFIFLGNKSYWLILSGCAAATSLLFQFVINGHGAGLITTLAQMATFLSLAFLMNLVKLIINK
ncbi:MAG: hypothetical protein IJW72_02420 [Alphaproteobacteria bacterium]|nr:hypothetical protein [Alphaproteobacteria bacterium]